MLEKKHPKKTVVPQVRISLHDFRAFLEMMTEAMGRAETTYSIQFNGTNGAKITTTDVGAIVPEDDDIPDTISNPTIKMRSTAGNEVELSSEQVANSGNVPQSRYVLATTSSDPIWAAGMVATTTQWLRRKQTPLFRFFWVLAISLVVLTIACFVVAVSTVPQGPGDQVQVSRNPLVLSLGIVAGLAFAVAFFIFSSYYSRLLVTVRQVRSPITILAVSLWLGVIASLFIIVQGVRSFMR